MTGEKKGLAFPEIPSELKLEDWWPMDFDKGPPLPKWLNIFWPWYKPPEVPPVYTCPYCGAQFSTQDELNKHIASAHPEQPPVYTCPYCGAQFSTQDELNYHIQTQHPTPVYTCPYCGATFSSQAELDAHIQVQHPTPPPVYTCPYCGATFSTEAELNSHIQTVHPTPVIAAEIIGGFVRNPAEPTSSLFSGWVELRLGSLYVDEEEEVAIDLTKFGRYLEAGFIWQNNSNVPVTCDFIIWHTYWTMVNKKQKYITEPPFVLPTTEPLAIPPAPTGLPMFNGELLCDKFTSSGSIVNPGEKGFIYTPVFEVSQRWNYIFITLKINGQEIQTTYIGGWGGY